MRALSLVKEGSESVPRLVLEERLRPVADKDHVLVRVHVSKINPSDLLNASGGFPYTTYPRVPGRDFAGTICDSPGDRSFEGRNVYGTSGNSLGFSVDGAHAEYILLDLRTISFMPTNLTFSQAASIGVPWSTALLMIQRSQLVEDGHRNISVLIIGERGNVGSAIKQLLHAKFKRISIQTCNRAADGHISLPEVLFDLIFSTVPVTSVLQDAILQLGSRGKLVFIATTRPKSDQLHIDPLQFYRNENAIIGVNSISCSMDEVKLLMDELTRLFESESVHLNSRPAKVMSLSVGVEAYAAARGGSDVYLQMT